MQTEEVSTFLQSLKGAQAIIILAYLMIQRAMDIDELVSLTGLHNQTVRAALKQLTTRKLLFLQRAAHGREVWLPAGDTLFPYFSVLQLTKFSYSGPVNNNIQSRILDGETSSSINSDQLTKISYSGKPAEEIQACLKALHQGGIYAEKAEMLSRLEWVTVEYIQAHIEAVKHEKWDRPLGMAIHRMETNQPVPEISLEAQPEEKQNVWGEFLGDGEESESICVWQDVLPETIVVAGIKRNRVSRFCGEKPMEGSRFCVKHQAQYDKESR